MTQPLVGKQILIVEDEQVFRSLLIHGFPHWERQRYWRLMGWMPLSCWEVSLQT